MALPLKVFFFAQKTDLKVILRILYVLRFDTSIYGKKPIFAVAEGGSIC